MRRIICFFLYKWNLCEDHYIMTIFVLSIVIRSLESEP